MGPFLSVPTTTTSFQATLIFHPDSFLNGSLCLFLPPNSSFSALQPKQSFKTPTSNITPWLYTKSSLSALVKIRNPYHGPTDVSVLTHNHSGIQQHFPSSLLRRQSSPFPSPSLSTASLESPLPFLPSLTPPQPSRNSWFICNLLRKTSHPLNTLVASPWWWLSQV